MQQATISAEFTLEGVGTHSGDLCRIRVKPADINDGIGFQVQDTYIAANYHNVVNTEMCTQLACDGVSIATVEHLMAAFFGTGVTNAVVYVEGKEIPIMDGSARPFVDAIKRVGIEQQNSHRSCIRVMQEVAVVEEGRWIMLAPSDDFNIHVVCDFSKRQLHTEPKLFQFSCEKFADEIAPARTFGFQSDVEEMRRRGLGRGSSLENVVVFDDSGGVINSEGLRFPQEPVHHKILDLIGDLSLSGYYILGKCSAYCPGHRMNHRLLQELFSDASNYAVII